MSGGLMGTPCPSCKKAVAASASVCPYCQRAFTPDEIAARKKLASKYVGFGCLGAIVLAAMLAMCSGPGATGAEFLSLPGLGNYAMIPQSGSAPSSWEAQAKEKCGMAEICGVYGWTDKADAARAWPLTDREVATQAFAYQLNRNSGLDRMLWDCRRFPQADKTECLGK